MSEAEEEERPRPAKKEAAEKSEAERDGSQTGAVRSAAALKARAARDQKVAPKPTRDADDEDDDDEEDEEDDEDLAPRKRAGTVKVGVRPPSLPSKNRGRFRDILGVLACVALVLIARASIIDHYVVPTGSMEPTVAINDRVVVSKASFGIRIPLTDSWLFRWSNPKHGDVVVLESPEVGHTILLKRVIGLPGDTVTVHHGMLTINGTKMPVDDRFLCGEKVEDGCGTEDLDGKKHIVSLAMRDGGPDFGPEKLPEGKYLVMGDNRGNSHDGREFGLVDGDAILGRAVRIYYSNGSFSWKPL